MNWSAPNIQQFRLLSEECVFNINSNINILILIARLRYEITMTHIYIRCNLLTNYRWVLLHARKIISPSFFLYSRSIMTRNVTANSKLVDHAGKSITAIELRVLNRYGEIVRNAALLPTLSSRRERLCFLPLHSSIDLWPPLMPHTNLSHYFSLSQEYYIIKKKEERKFINY